MSLYPANSPGWASNCLVNVSNQYTGCNLTERPALVDLFVATNSAPTGWKSWTLWLSGVHPCSGWFGVYCTAGFVTYVLAC